MNNTRSHIISGLLAFVPYLLVSWAYMALTDGNANDFWTALGVLLIVRLFFGIIETFGSMLTWRVYGKKIMVDRNLQFLRAHEFPRRKYAHDGVSAYLLRIEGDPEYTAPLKAIAKEMRSILELCEDIGILVGMRMHSAAEAALDIYSPKAEAPVLGTS